MADKVKRRRDMDEPERAALKRRLKRQLIICRELLEEFGEGVTAENLRELESELQRRFKEFDK